MTSELPRKWPAKGSERMALWHRRQRDARQQLGEVAGLMTAAGKPPSVMAATALSMKLRALARHVDGEAAAIASCAVAEADAYVREMGRESWRRPGPKAFLLIAEKATQVARIAAEQAEAVLAEPPPEPPEDVADHETEPLSGVADSELLDDWYDNPYLWRDCYRGSISLSHTDVPPAVMRRAVEKHLDGADLGDAYVVVEDDIVVAYWAPDEHEEWERDLLLSTLEDAAQAAGLTPNRARVRWKRSHQWERVPPP